MLCVCSDSVLTASVVVVQTHPHHHHYFWHCRLRCILKTLYRFYSLLIAAMDEVHHEIKSQDIIVELVVSEMVE